MQLSFDPRDQNACASVIATIAALHGSAPFDDVEAIAAFDISSVPAAPVDSGPSAQDAFGSRPTPPPAPPVSPAEDTAGATSPTPAPAASPNPGKVEVDANGLPWDSRIHSGPADKRPQNADGTWRKRRGVSDDEVQKVEGELRAALGAPAAPVEAPTASVPPAPAPVVPAAPVPASPSPAPVAPAPTAAPAAPVPTPPAAPTESGPAVATTANSAAPVTDFASLMRKITGMQAAGTLTVEATADIAKALGITGVRDLITRPDLVPSFDALLPA